MKAYQDLLRDILENGKQREDRTGTGTISVFGRHLRFNLQDGFPLLTTKRVHFKSIVYELLWFLSGNDSIKYLKDKGITIWNEWSGVEDSVGPVYGVQWRGWENSNSALFNYIDQIQEVITSIKENPNSRRHLVSAWNVSDLEYMALPPCHYAFQFYVDEGKLSCMFQMRSTDVFLGLPFNIASYALLTHMIAQQCDLEVGELIWNGGDVHIYSNHIDQVHQQLSRDPRTLPSISINKRPDIDSYVYEDFTLSGYDPYPTIKADISV